MNAWIKRLSPPAEFLIVILCAFGLLIITSSFRMVGPLRPRIFTASNQWAYGLLLYELVVLGLIAFFLRARGWRIRDFNLQVTWRLWGLGLLLMISAYVLIVISYLVMKSLWNGIDTTVVSFDAGQVGLLSAAVVSVVNPVFEETLVVGYVVGALQRQQKVRLGVMMSASIRALYHGYQGVFAVIAVMLLGLLFAYAYYRWNRLWPLIVAHGFMDFLGLLAHR